jgi:hypothetical protein
VSRSRAIDELYLRIFWVTVYFTSYFVCIVKLLENMEQYIYEYILYQHYLCKNRFYWYSI